MVNGMLIHALRVVRNALIALYARQACYANITKNANSPPLGMLAHSYLT